MIWVHAPGARAVNLARVVMAEVHPLAAVPAGGNVRFYFSTVSGDYADVVIAGNDLDAEDALVRLVDAVDPASYA